MKRYVWLAIGMIVGFLISAGAVFAEVPRWQHSIFAPVGTVAREPDGQYHFRAFAGAGYQLAWTVLDKGNLNVLGLGFTNVVDINSAIDQFSYTIGLNVNFAGNFGIGAGYDVVNTGSQTGLATGTSSWDDNGKLYLSFHLPFNGGGLLNTWQKE